DLGRDLLDDADVVRALREVLIEAVDRRLVPGDLLAKPLVTSVARAHGSVLRDQRPAPTWISDSGIRSPHGLVTDPTRKMSADRSLKMPFIPTIDAIASICMSIAAKIGPLVSE